MELLINGENKRFAKALNIQEILDTLGIESKVVAVALNAVVVKKHDWGNTFPKDGDKIEFLQFMGGGGFDGA
ncbi:thiamine biosynthesis protein ThiS [Helicobacter sp. 11S02596-1]|nr:sulfur carrier protein ThiS [Helicobacter sp. 11S02596-1]PAF42875.1 thiamine biosynthesis protein ThiS [Helicobacter sp. 11S02596-1]